MLFRVPSPLTAAAAATAALRIATRRLSFLDGRACKVQLDSSDHAARMSTLKFLIDMLCGSGRSFCRLLGSTRILLLGDQSIVDRRIFNMVGSISFAFKFARPLLLLCMTFLHQEPDDHFDGSTFCSGEPRCIKDTNGIR